MSLGQAKIAMSAQGYVVSPQMQFFDFEFWIFFRGGLVGIRNPPDDFIDQQIGIAVDSRTG